MAQKDILNFINGQAVSPASGRFLDNFEPATGEVYSRVADSDESDVLKAVKAASEAFPAWSRLPTEERVGWLRKLADALEKRLEDFARAESIDTGKPLRVARTLDIPRSVLNFRFFADAIGQFSGDCFAKDETTLNYTLRKPLGVVAAISPWNLPLYLFTWKIAPALACGNTVVAKPSEFTPMTAFMLGELCQEIGFPKGVLNIVQGTGSRVGSALTQHRDIKAVTFTGSTRTGGEIARATAPGFKKLALEMGGKNPTIVFADCDFDETVKQTLRAAFSNQGQICLCGSRILVDRSIYPKFRDALVARTKELVVGDPLEEKTDQGALVSKNHFDKVATCVSVAKEEGGRILTGGKPLEIKGRCQGGWFFEPTLVENLASGCRTNQEEIFGPVATLLPFLSEVEAVAVANDTAYGLSASVFTGDLKRAHRVAAQIESGIVWINTWMNRDLRTPFGGVKNSGLGREGGLEALRFFTEIKNICLDI